MWGTIQHWSFDESLSQICSQILWFFFKVYFVVRKCTSSLDWASHESLAFLTVSHYIHLMCELMNYCMLLCCHAHTVTPCLQAHARVAHWNSFKAIFKFNSPLRFSLLSFIKHPQSDGEASRNIFLQSRSSLKGLIGSLFAKHTIRLKATYAALIFAVRNSFSTPDFAPPVHKNVQPQVSTIEYKILLVKWCQWNVTVL